MLRSRKLTSSTLRSTKEKLYIAMDLDSVTGRTNGSRVTNVATDIVKEEIAASVPIESDNYNKVKFVKDPNPSGSTSYQCLIEDLKNITFSVSGCVDRRSDFCVVPESVPLGRKLNAFRVDRYVVKLRLDSRTSNSSMASVQSKPHFTLFYFEFLTH